MSDVGTWSTTDANNNSAVPNGFPEGMAPSGLNDSARALMGGAARWFFDINGSLSAGGSTNTYTLTTNAGFSATAEHSLLVFRVPVKNTGASTLNIDGLGAKAIRKNGNLALDENDLVANGLVSVAYNPTNDVYNLVAVPTYNQPMVLLASGSMTSAVASVTFGPISANFQNAMLEFSNIKAVTDATNLWFRIGTTADMIDGAADYAWSKNQTAHTGTSTGTGDTADAQMVVFTSAGNADNEFIAGRIYVHGLNSSNNRPSAEWLVTAENSGDDRVTCSGGGGVTANTSCHALQILFSSGNIDGTSVGAFTYRLYGLP